jgi:hypothetical protein
MTKLVGSFMIGLHILVFPVSFVTLEASHHLLLKKNDTIVGIPTK